MPTPNFNTDAGKTVERSMLVAFLNTGTEQSPVWSPVGKRVVESSEEIDWSKETKTDIFGQTYTTMKKPVITQSFDPCELDAGDTAQTHLWKLAVVEQDVASLANQDMLIVHKYAGTANTAVFAERYKSCAIEVTGLGGEGTVDMPITVTYGGERIVGTASVSGSSVTFSEAA